MEITGLIGHDKCLEMRIIDTVKLKRGVSVRLRIVRVGI